MPVRPPAPSWPGATFPATVPVGPVRDTGLVRQVTGLACHAGLARHTGPVRDTGLVCHVTGLVGLACHTGPIRHTSLAGHARAHTPGAAR
ncbi:hypothetical protein GCM10010339_36920 [Streptomyces alanosinicus]|uniref:Uncharacterized protein n=1 Tax=Streptomyces alanosinicus TaxID=68171 RepID=A0A918YHW3_9ACTN|nr:hypothetical protein GCM10010339_36920 [Streptomyces alanosinicus]